MKKIVFAGLMLLASMSVFAQKWTVDGNVNFNLFSWNAGDIEDETTSFLLTLRAGRYVTDRLNIGIRGSFGIEDDGYSFSAGPSVRYDFYEIDKVYFSVTGGVFYTRFIESYPWNDYFTGNDANRIHAIIAPSVAYKVNSNVEVFWQFASIEYRYIWLTLKETEFDCTVSDFRIQGPLANPAFGIRFRF